MYNAPDISPLSPNQIQGGALRFTCARDPQSRWARTCSPSAPCSIQTTRHGTAVWLLFAGLSFQAYCIVFGIFQIKRERRRKTSLFVQERCEVSAGVGKKPGIVRTRPTAAAVPESAASLPTAVSLVCTASSV